MKLTFILLLFVIGCSNSKNAVRLDKEITELILKTELVAKLTRNQKKVINKAILANIKLYTESCKKDENKNFGYYEVVFLKIFKKNPSLNLLRMLNENFNSNDWIE